MFNVNTGRAIYMTECRSKWKQVESEIRKLIVSGEWKVGKQLPTYDELELRFKVSRITLQQVIRHLKQDSFITSLARQGLFVSKTPPYLTKVGVVIPRDENEVRYWKELVLSAQAVAAQTGKEIVVYRNMENSPESERKLLHDVENHMLSGIIFTSPVIPGTPGYTAYSNPLIPKVVSTSDNVSEKLTMRFHLDEPQMVKRALGYLKEEGASRIALFSNIGPGISSLFDAEIKNRKLYSPSEWRFKISLQNVELAEKIAYLLMCFSGKDRPDGIFISDDNLASAVIKGIASTRLRIPEDVAIVSHYNWSAGMRDHLQVKGIGFDLKSMLFKIFEAISSYHESGHLPELLEVAPVFEEELSVNQINKGEMYYEKSIHSYAQA
jgi:DNA-binding LacI/PurR family transcriptional regulator